MTQCLVGESLFLTKGSMFGSLNKQMKESTSELCYSSIYHILISYSKATEVLFGCFIYRILRLSKALFHGKILTKN